MGRVSKRFDRIEKLILNAQLPKARRLLHRLSRRISDRSNQLNRFRTLAVSLGEEKMALKVSRLLVKRSPNNHKHWVQLIQLLLHLGKTKAALRRIEQAPNSVGLQIFSELNHPALDARWPSLRTSDSPADFQTLLAVMRRHDFQQGSELLEATLQTKHAAGQTSQLQRLQRWRAQIKASCHSQELVRTWSTSFELPTADNALVDVPIPPIVQYWAQGPLPKELHYIQHRWKALLKPQGIIDWVLFDRDAALAWIEAEAPQFLISFHSAFHFAVEADVFRVAYASRMPVIWLDVDLFPTPSAGRFLRRALNRGVTCLFTRPFAPFLLNGFFSSSPSCRFVQMLAEQCAGIDFSVLPKTGRTITSTYGCDRFNKVLAELCRQPHRQDHMVLRGDNWGIQFANSKTFARSKPPLAYRNKSPWQTACTDR